MLRPDLRIIAKMVDAGARVLDLGCGDGALLQYLQDTKRVRGYGLEIDPKNIRACLDAGVNVIQRNLNDGLEDLARYSFDVLIMAETLQTIRRPDKLLEQMLKVSKKCIVTLPNFGHFSCRLQLLGGRMPVSKNLPHEWYATPNIHLCTFADFERLCSDNNFQILERRIVDANYQLSRAASLAPRLFGMYGVYQLCGSTAAGGA